MEGCRDGRWRRDEGMSRRRCDRLEKRSFVGGGVFVCGGAVFSSTAVLCQDDVVKEALPHFQLSCSN